MDLGLTYPHRGSIWIVNLEPTIGSEMKKVRPCLIISPDEANQNLRTVIVAPLTSTIKNYPSRIAIVLEEKERSIALDQMRTIDKSRLLRQFAVLQQSDLEDALSLCCEMFEL